MERSKCHYATKALQGWLDTICRDGLPSCPYTRFPTSRTNFSCEKHKLHGHWGSNPRLQHHALLSLTIPPHTHLFRYQIFFLLILCSTEFKMSVWESKRFQMKMSSTTKLFNFLISITFVLAISPSETIRKIQISNVRN